MIGTDLRRIVEIRYKPFFFDMEKNISSKIIYAARLISKDDQSAGGYHYSSLDTIIYLLQWYESKHVGAEENKLNFKSPLHLVFGQTRKSEM